MPSHCVVVFQCATDKGRNIVCKPFVVSFWLYVKTFANHG